MQTIFYNNWDINEKTSFESFGEIKFIPDLDSKFY